MTELADLGTMMMTMMKTRMLTTAKKNTTRLTRARIGHKHLVMVSKLSIFFGLTAHT